MRSGNPPLPGGGQAVIRQASAADLPAVRELTRLAYARYRDRMDIDPAPVRNDYAAEAAAGQIWVLGLDGPGSGNPGLGNPGPGSSAPGSPAPGSPAPGSPAPGSPAPGSPAPAIAGVIVLIESAGSLLIENVAVSPDAQGAGLGRHLMEFAEEQARARGISRMTLYTNEVMTENLAIYAHLGYRETSRAEQDRYRRVFMEKRLD